MSELEDFIQELASKGQVVTVAYGGGSRPGESRELVITSLHDSYFSGYEVGGRKTKNYRLDRVIWVEDSAGRRIVTGNTMITIPSIIEIPEFDSLAEYSDYLRTGLQQAGWHIHQSEVQFGVGTHFKNGKPRKTPSVAVTYCDRSSEFTWDFEENELVCVQRDPTGRERPWRLDSWRFDACKTYSLLHHAMVQFLHETLDSDPREAKNMYYGHGG